MLKGGPPPPNSGGLATAAEEEGGERRAEAGDEEEGCGAVPRERAAEEVEQLERLQMMADLPESGPAQPQRVKVDGQWRDVWPHQWGMTIAQLRALMREAKKNKEKPLQPDANVHTLVHDYIIPKTAKKGVGYAVLLNADEPKEVNIMVSHAWSENAELFFRRLERSVCEDDVLFICAFSLYQNQDGFGPTILQQLGQTAAESPFRRVLEHIQGKRRRTRLITVRPLLMKLPYLIFAGTLTFFSGRILALGCVPRFDECHYFTLDLEMFMPELFGRLHWQRKLIDERDIVGLCIALTLLGFLVTFVLRRRKIYDGYMLAVPNRNCDLYSRLWCVYEIFVATEMSIPVVLARTFARAGYVEGSPSRSATCCCSDDIDRIRAEIEGWGNRLMGDPQLGYELVDKAIWWTTRAAKRQIVWAVLQFLWPFSVFNIIRSALIRDKIQIGSTGHFANGLGLWCAAMMSTFAAYGVVKRAEGRPGARVIIAAGCLLVLFGSLGNLAISFSPLEEESRGGGGRHRDEGLTFMKEFLLEFCSFTAWSGAVFVGLTLGALLLPEWMVRLPERRHIGFEVALVVMVLMVLCTSIEMIFGDEVPHATVYCYLFAPIATLPLVIWYLAVQWGVSIARPPRRHQEEEAAPRASEMPGHTVTGPARAAFEDGPHAPRGGGAGGGVGDEHEEATPSGSELPSDSGGAADEREDVTV